MRNQLLSSSARAHTHTLGRSGKQQYSLLNFWGSPEQKAAAKPAFLEAKPELYKRSQKAKYQLDHEAELAALRQQVTELQLTQAETQEEIAAIVQRSKTKQNKRPFSDVLALEDSQSPASTNRKKPGTQRARLELSAKLKLKYSKEMLQDKDRFTHLSDFWAAQKKKHGLRKHQLQHILKKQGVLAQITKQKVDKSKLKVVKKHRARASESGRKVPFPQLISELKLWLSLERPFGHRDSKADLMSEFLARLQVQPTKPGQPQQLQKFLHFESRSS